MSEEKTQSVADSNGKSRQTAQSYQPVWMARWMRPSNAAADRRTQGACGNEEYDHVSKVNDLTNGSRASRPVKELGVFEAKNFQIFSSKGLENEASCRSLTKHGQDIEDQQALRRVFIHNLEHGKAVNETSFKRANSLGEGTSKNPPEWIKTHPSTKDDNFDASKPFHETVVGSSTHIAPYHNLESNEFDKGKGILSPLTWRTPNDQFLNSNLRILEPNHCYKQGQSAGLTFERKIGHCPESETTMDMCFREINSSLLFDAPSTSDQHLPTFAQDWFQKMQNRSGIALLPSQCTASEKPESKKPRFNSYSLQKLPNYAHDIKTIRICTTVDSVAAAPGGYPRFSQTTCSPLIAKDVNLSKENGVFGTSELITEMNGTISTDIHNRSPFSSQGNRGVKLQSLSSSSNSKGKRNIGDVMASKVVIKNESSAETDTMDMDLFEENSNPGAKYTTSAKGFNIETNSSPRIHADFSREVGCHWKNTVLPDINQELPALPAVAGSSENACPTASRTQSLERETLLAHSEHPKRNFNLSLGNSSEADPTMRWVKRLKLRSSNSSSQGARSSILAENSSPDKMKNIFGRIFESGIASSEPTPKNHQTREPTPKNHQTRDVVMSDRSAGLSKDEEDFMAKSMCKELLLSQAWIKRWLQNGSRVTKNKPETVAVCEPQSSKLTPDDFQKKQFPSIAAMALMGKSMNGLQSCELQKRGSFTVWNTKAF